MSFSFFSNPVKTSLYFFLKVLGQNKTGYMGEKLTPASTIKIYLSLFEKFEIISKIVSRYTFFFSTCSRNRNLKTAKIFRTISLQIFPTKQIFYRFRLQFVGKKIEKKEQNLAENRFDRWKISSKKILRFRIDFWSSKVKKYQDLLKKRGFEADSFGDGLCCTNEEPWGTERLSDWLNA